MVPRSEQSLDVAEPCLPSNQTCGLEDSEPGRSWLGQRKDGGGARRTEKEGRWTPELQGGCVSERNLASYLTEPVSPSVQWAEYLLCVNR